MIYILIQIQITLRYDKNYMKVRNGTNCMLLISYFFRLLYNKSPRRGIGVDPAEMEP